MPVEWNFADVWETVGVTIPEAFAQVHGERRGDWRTCTCLPVDGGYLVK